MSTAIILFPALLIYIGLLYWLYTYFNVKEIWHGNNIEFVQSIDKPLFNFVKGVLDLFMVLLLFTGVMLIPAAVILGLSHGSSPTWGIDISIFSGFSLDLNAISGIQASGLRNPEITGKSIIAIDTSNITAFYLFIASQGALTLVSLYGITQIRSLVMSLKNGNAFCSDNATRIKRVGLLVIIWNVISPMFQYFAWGSVINEISFSNEGIRLYPAFEFDILAIFIGAMMIILSDLFVEATKVSEEQRFTI